MKKYIQSHKDLIVWQKAMDLVIEIYKLTQTFPKEELYGLSQQMRRAAIAIPSNIAEGYQRNHIKEYIQFLFIAKSSGSELETQLIITRRLHFGNPDQQIKAEELLTEIIKMLTKLISRLNSQKIPETNP